LTYGDGLVGAVDASQAPSRIKVALVHADDDGGADPRLLRFLAPERVAADLEQRIGTHLADGSHICGVLIR